MFPLSRSRQVLDREGKPCLPSVSNNWTRMFLHPLILEFIICQVEIFYC
jgi:hypothetical protein